MRAGLLDRRVSIQRQGEPIDDGVTTVPGGWIEVGTRKAQVIRSRGREVFENLGRESEVPVTFVMRSDTLTRSITVTDKIVFEEQSFDIQSVQEIGRRDGIECVGVASDEG